MPMTWLPQVAIKHGTEEVWQDDKLHGSHYEVYSSRRNFEKGARNRVVCVPLIHCILAIETWTLLLRSVVECLIRTAERSMVERCLARRVESNSSVAQGSRLGISASR